MSETITLAKNINGLVQHTDDYQTLLTEVCAELSRSIRANVVVADRSGDFIASHLTEDYELSEGRRIGGEINDQFKNIRESLDNVALTVWSETEDIAYIAGVFPIIAKAQRVGTMLIYRRDSFAADELVQAEVCAAIVSLALNYSVDQINTEYNRRYTMVQGAIGTLSYSEREAILNIFQELGSKEGFVVASRIADRVGITRSVIVNALRKLESAGVIESRSLGMKGTYIKVLNDSFLHELRKLRA